GRSAVAAPIGCVTLWEPCRSHEIDRALAKQRKHLLMRSLPDFDTMTETLQHLVHNGTGDGVEAQRNLPQNDRLVFSVLLLSFHRKDLPWQNAEHRGDQFFSELLRRN